MPFAPFRLDESKKASETNKQDNVQSRFAPQLHAPFKPELNIEPIP
jgi:hypothetical protein